jgi:short subunit dehydrogenase-like uncharacterized protein
MYHLTLFGATGFTGRLIAAYLAEHAPAQGLTWAIAGRSRSKLEALRDSLPGEPPAILIADSADYASLRAMAASSTLVLNAAGPFALYGPPVVEACIAEGAHYIDITGEPGFINATFLRHDIDARAKGVAVVNACGFDSIPADTAVYEAVRTLPAAVPKAVRCYVRTNATFSAGTLRTAVLSVAAKQSGRREAVVRGPKHPDTPRISRRIHWNRRFRAWALPMPVADVHIVKRSALRMPEVYGAAFAYGQFFLARSTGSMLKLVAGVLMLFALARFRWFRERLLTRFEPGTGPDPARRAASFFEVTAIAETVDGRAAEHVIRGGDPGYDETAKMAADAAIAILAKHRAGTLKHGVLTPVEALIG